MNCDRRSQLTLAEDGIRPTDRPTDRPTISKNLRIEKSKMMCRHPPVSTTDLATSMAFLFFSYKKW